MMSCMVVGANSNGANLWQYPRHVVGWIQIIHVGMNHVIDLVGWCWRLAGEAKQAIGAIQIGPGAEDMWLGCRGWLLVAKTVELL
jgi:hypothetical protein